MKIITAKASTKASSDGNNHFWEEDDVVLVRFEQSGNLDADEYYDGSELKSIRKRRLKAQNFVWHAGKVAWVSDKGHVSVKLFDGDRATIRPSNISSRLKRTTPKRLKKVKGNENFAGELTSKEMVMLTKGNLKSRNLKDVLDKDELETIEREIIQPVKKLSTKKAYLKSVYEEHKWLGSWVMAPISDKHNKKYVLPAAMIGFAKIGSKSFLILKADLSGEDESLFDKPWTVMQLFDRDPSKTFEKLDRLAQSAKSKLPSGTKRMKLSKLQEARKAARKIKM